MKYISRKEVKQRFLSALNETFYNDNNLLNCPALVSFMEEFPLGSEEALCRYCQEIFPKINQLNGDEFCPCSKYGKRTIKEKVKAFFSDEKWDSNKNACLIAR